MPRDPVCGMTVTPESAKDTVQLNGETFYFCSRGCAEKFRRDPELYLHSKDHAAAAAHTAHADHVHSAPSTQIPPAHVLYTCPMHPQIVQKGPGFCPICGMALEPMTVQAGAESKAELSDMSRRFWLSVILTVPLVILAMARHMPGAFFHRLMSWSLGPWLELALANPVVLWCGWPFFVRGWASIVHRRLNMFTLIAIGVGVSYVYSVVATLAPWIFPPSFRGQDGQVGVYFEVAAAIKIGRAHV